MTEEQLATVPTEDAGAVAPNGPADLDVVRIYNEELDAYGESPRAGVQFLHGWEVVDPTPEQAVELTDYDPSAHSRDEVLAKLAEVSVTEAEAILALEADGKARKTVLEWTPPDDPNDV